MLEKMYLDDTRHTDMNLYRCGMEDCRNGHSWGPAVRDHYIVHYILDGKGIYTVDGKSYHLQKHDGFLICPGTVVYYQADDTDPWSYGWVGFSGFKASTYLKQAGLDHQRLTFRYDQDDSLKACLKRMIETKNLSKSRDIKLLGLLYEFLAQLVETAGHPPIDKENKKEEYVGKALEYIRMNYSRKVTVAEIAHYVGLDRSYLYSLFLEYIHSSPQDFLIRFRMEKAGDLMRTTSLNIGSIACSVGYEDPLLFSRAFKKVKGVCPRDYRKQVWNPLQNL